MLATMQEELGPVLHAYNLSTLQVEAGGSKIQGCSWLHREFEASLSYIQTLSQKEKYNTDRRV